MRAYESAEFKKPVDIIADGHRDFGEFAPSMLTKKVVEMIFLPWLSAFTGRVVEAAKEEERRAILAELSRHLGKDRRAKAALDKVRAIIVARSL